MIAFVYKWTHLPTLNWYVGSSIGKRKNYICSSKFVKDQILKNSNEWSKTIVATGDYTEMYNLESIILKTLDAKNDSRSFNKHNNDGVNSLLAHTPEARAKRSAKVKGRARTEEVRAILSKAQKGRIITEKHKAKLSAAMKGKPWTEARRLAQKKETI